MSGPTITVARHGLTEWARDGRYTGRTDLPLLPEGEAQARALAPRLARRPIRAAFTSPLQRARRTADLAGFPQAIDDPDLMEWDYGDVEGELATQYQADHPDWFLWRDGPVNGESIASIGARADRVIERVLASGLDTVLFAHGHLLDVLASRWLEQPVAFAMRLRLGPATLSTLGWQHGRRVLLEWNSDGA
jgi:broad specificity phosphatase PhoE